MTPRLFVAAVIAVVVLAGCSAASRLQSSLGNKYKYSYQLMSPSSGYKMSFQDRLIRIQFLIDDGAIRFKLTNKSIVPIRIKWDDVSVGVRGRYYAARNTRTLYLADYQDKAVPVIPPNGYVIDLALPSENISYDGKQWKEKELLPVTDRNSEEMRNRILAHKGSTVNLMLPIVAGEATVLYDFRFQVMSVEPVAWERYRRPRRPLPPPLLIPSSAKIEADSDDQLITAIVAAGLLGVGAILLTQKKSPVVE